MSPDLLHTYSVGAKDAPALVFLHGFLGRGTDWDPVTSILAETHRCITVDLPGHGQSLDVADGYTFEGAADAVRTTLVTMNIQRPVMVGYSMGGRLALYLALRFPKDFGGVVVESASPGLASAAERTARIEHDRAVAKRLMSMPREEFLAAWYRQPLFQSLADRDEVLRERIRGRMQNDSAELARALMGMGTGSQPSLWEELPGLEIPGLFIAGEKDPKFVELGRKMAACCPAATLEVVHAAGHTVHAEQPAALAQRIGVSPRINN